MRFELRGIGGKITDAVRRVAPKWTHRFVQREDQLEQHMQRGESLERMVHTDGWSLLMEYINDRRQSAQASLENASNLTNEKALELAGVQGRVKELRQMMDWVEHNIKRGAEAAKVLAERKQK